MSAERYSRAVGLLSVLGATEIRQENPVQKGTFPSRERGAAVERLADAAMVTLPDTRAVDGGSPEKKEVEKMGH